MISEADKLSRGFTAKNAGEKSDIAGAGGQTTSATPRSSPQKPFAKEARPGANIGPGKPGFRMSQTAAKAAAKGGRPAAHGHSRHK